MREERLQRERGGSHVWEWGERSAHTWREERGAGEGRSEGAHQEGVSQKESQAQARAVWTLVTQAVAEM